MRAIRNDSDSGDIVPLLTRFFVPATFDPRLNERLA